MRTIHEDEYEDDLDRFEQHLQTRKGPPPARGASSSDSDADDPQVIFFHHLIKLRLLAHAGCCYDLYHIILFLSQQD